MPTIFDLFGIPIDDRSEKAEATRKSCQCPFMSDICDGGGNRHQTAIKITVDEPLSEYFNSGITRVVPGVCSIASNNEIWVVCPRRLFAARHVGPGMPPLNGSLQSYERNLLVKAGMPPNITFGIWSEVALRFSLEDADINYHFDYVAAPIIEISLRQAISELAEVEEMDSTDISSFTKSAKDNGYYDSGSKVTLDTPVSLPDLSSPFIIEVMTASTSGSNNEKGTDMAQAFRYAILTGEHASPGINKRQVWGRMVTQLFAKTALAAQWGGKAVWVIQDELLRNIELTTRLKTTEVPKNETNNINLIVMHYEVDTETLKRKMSFKKAIQGDAGLSFAGNDTFTDILLPKIVPNKIELLRAILRRKLAAIVRL